MVLRIVYPSLQHSTPLFVLVHEQRDALMDPNSVRQASGLLAASVNEKRGHVAEQIFSIANSASATDDTLKES